MRAPSNKNVLESIFEVAIGAIKTEVDFDPKMPEVDEEDGWVVDVDLTTLNDSDELPLR